MPIAKAWQFERMSGRQAGPAAAGAAESAKLAPERVRPIGGLTGIRLGRARPLFDMHRRGFWSNCRDAYQRDELDDGGGVSPAGRPRRLCVRLDRANRVF